MKYLVGEIRNAQAAKKQTAATNRYCRSIFRCRYHDEEAL